ncbi:hypothetical protein E2C01_040175 [Portunus trituberculatus]|uniref:Uncharacterized protein n=1 Tax=Portunus trituberculatus TaxID=210409 RepID=A0A5B7FLX1_PORTR|nr:hypothetical protein [Portunus trituberculatus]
MTLQSSIPENEAHSRVDPRAMEGGPQKEATWRPGVHEDVDDGTLAHSAHEKANLLARHFAGKMSVPDPERPSPTMLQIIKDIFFFFIIGLTN